jgi:hypothetical protein
MHTDFGSAVVASSYEMTVRKNGDVVLTFELPPDDGSGPTGLVRSACRVVRGSVPVLKLDFERGAMAFPDVSDRMLLLLMAAPAVVVKWVCADGLLRAAEVPMARCRACL